MSSSFLFISLLFILSCFANRHDDNITTSSFATTFNGIWQLDTTKSESIDTLLKLIGLSWFKRNIIVNLKVTETYLLSSKSVSIHTMTSMSDNERIYVFGIEEEIDDDIIGRGRQLTQYKEGKLFYRFNRENSDAVYQSVKEILSNGEMRISMNFSIPSTFQFASCRRVFTKNDK